MKNKKARAGIIAGVVVVALLALGISATTVVPAGHSGVVVTMGRVQKTALDEGLHFKMPFVQQIILMNNKIQKTEVASNSVSKDLQTVSSSVAINFHITKDAASDIYQNIGEQYADTVLQPAIQESVKAVTAQYTAEEMITKRSAVGDEIGQALSDKVSEYGILIDKFNIINFDFSEEFNAAIEQKQVAEQNKLRAETEKEQQIIEAEAAAKQKVIAAEAEAEATLKKAEAEAAANEKSLFMFLAMASNVLSARTFAFPLLKYLRNCISCFKSPKEPSACMLRFVLKRIPSSESIRSKSSFLCFRNVFAT